MELLMEKFINMFVEDQQARINGSKGMKVNLEEINKKHVEAVKPWVIENGWDVRGDEEIYLFSIVQHADHDVEFQEHCLALMKEVSIRRDLVAYLEDRCRVNRGKKQLYGTQVTISEVGIPVPDPIEDSAVVDIRRMAVGLPPMSEYLAEIAAHY